jgi:hypothetical protein
MRTLEAAQVRTRLEKASKFKKKTSSRKISRRSGSNRSGSPRQRDRVREILVRNLLRVKDRAPSFRDGFDGGDVIDELIHVLIAADLGHLGYDFV